jgi:DNA-binding NarL/FixJ family response regulator
VCQEAAIDSLRKSLQVYIVEDSPIIRWLLASTIEAAGAELVGHSADAQTAIADLSVLEPDLILVDIRLKAGSGFEVLKALQERHLLPTAMKAVLSNHANAEYKQLSFRLGADCFFDKSSETSHVLPLIGALVADRQRGGNLPRLASDSGWLAHGR